MKKPTTILFGLLLLAIIGLIYLFLGNKSLKSDLKRAEAFNNNYEAQISGLSKTVEDITEQYYECSKLVSNLQIQANRKAVLEKQRMELAEENRRQNSYKALTELELRQNPDENSTIIGEIRIDDVLELKASGFEYNYVKKDYPNEWWKVEFENRIGWVVAKKYYTDLFGDGQQKLKENLLIIQ